MKEKIMDLIIEEQGQGMTEYGLVLSFIAVGAVTVVGYLATIVESMFDLFFNVGKEIEKAT